MQNIIAVYGSLKQGAYNHPRLHGAKFIGTSTITGAMYLVAQSYPGLILLEDFTGSTSNLNDHEIQLYAVDKETYDNISMMERGAGYKPAEKTFRLLEDPEKTVKATIYAMEEYPGEREWITAYNKDTVPQAYI